MVETINLFEKLGFIIQPVKIKFIPAKIVEYLGFIIDSEKMKHFYRISKNKKFMRNVASFQQNQNKKIKLTIKEFASFIGTDFREISLAHCTTEPC